MKRFYPDSLPSFPNEPSPDNFEICRIADSVGEGIVARTNFFQGEIVCAFTGYFSSSITQFSLTVSPELHLHDPYFMGKILHSCDPNLHCDMTQRIFVALRDINPGDIITMDYEQTEDRLYRPFHCSCGAELCRGFITGKSVRHYPTDIEQASVEEGSREPVVQDHITARQRKVSSIPTL